MNSINDFNDILDSDVDINDYIGMWFDCDDGKNTSTLIFAHWNDRLGNADFIDPKNYGNTPGWTVQRDGKLRSDLSGHMLRPRFDLRRAFTSSGAPIAK